MAAFTLDDAPLPVAERSSKKADSLEVEQDAAIAEPALERAMEANSKTAVNLDLPSGGSGAPVPEHPATVGSDATPRSSEERDEAPAKRAAAPERPLTSPTGARPMVPREEPLDSGASDEEVPPADSEAAVPQEEAPSVRPKVVGKKVRGALTGKGDVPIARAKPQIAGRGPLAPPAPAPVAEDEDESVYDNVSEVTEEEMDEPEAGFSSLAEVATAKVKVVEASASDSGTFAGADKHRAEKTLVIFAWLLRIAAAMGIGVAVKLVLIAINLGGSVPINAIIAAIAGLIFVVIPLGVGEGLLALYAIQKRIR